MKATGIVRKVDELGRVVLPMELRRTMGIDEKTSLEIYVNVDSIVLRKYNPGCDFCGSVDQLFAVDGTRVCRECAIKLAKKLKEEKD